MAGRPYRDISAERRARAVACVDRHAQELAGILADERLACRVVEGSGVAAEVYLAETNTLHTAVRVAVLVHPDERPALERALRQRGFERGAPTGDGTLLRLAAAGGRRPVHVIFEGEASGADGRSLHPADPAAARARDARFVIARLDVLTAFRRVRHESRAGQDATESFEVQLIPMPVPGSGRPAPLA